MKFSLEDIENISSKLKTMPEVKNAPTLSKADAVRMLSGEIESLKKRGYTFEQIAEALTSNGLQITTPTLKNYLHRSKQSEKNAEKGSKGKQISKKSGSKKEANSANTTPRGSFAVREDTDEI